MMKIRFLAWLFPSAGTKADSEQKDEDLFVCQHSSKPHVGSRISSCPTKPLACIERHWSEMSTWEKVEAGPFVCIVNPDDYDKRWGKYLEYFTLFKSQEEYDEQKNYVIETGRWEEFVLQ